MRTLAIKNFLDPACRPQNIELSNIDPLYIQHFQIGSPRSVMAEGIKNYVSRYGYLLTDILERELDAT